MILYCISTAIFLLIVALVIFIATRPAEFRIERSGQVGAPPGDVFAIINDLHQWHHWSPWEKLDRNMKKTFDGPATGPGSSMAWAGNSKAGEGRNTIVDIQPNQQISMKLEMYKPFPANNRVTFNLVPEGTGTRVSWIMEGRKNFMTKAFTMIMNMDKMVGKDFEEGLANLNNVARSQAQPL